MDQCLQLTMRVHEYLLRKKDAFFLLDPCAGNRQCHLYALMDVLIMKNPLAREKYDRFVHLSFFLNYAFVNDPALYRKTVEKAMKEMGEKAPSPKKLFEAFLFDEGGRRDRAARKALVSLFEESLKQMLASREEPLFKELFAIAQLNLQVPSTHSKRDGSLYTYPHLAGIVLVLDAIARENIPFAIKAKVLTPEGTAGTVYQTSRPVEPDEPILVFEGMTTSGALSILDVREKAKSCPHFFLRNEEKNRRHPEEDSCFFCKKVAGDLTPIQESLKQLMLSPEKMFYALGADYLNRVEADFKPLLLDSKKFPLLTQIYQESIGTVDDLGVGLNNPRAFSLCHVRPDRAGAALFKEPFLESSPEKFLKTREIL